MIDRRPSGATRSTTAGRGTHQGAVARFASVSRRNPDTAPYDAETFDEHSDHHRRAHRVRNTQCEATDERQVS